MKIKLGIVGYGNLGKEVEKLIINNNEFKLIAIFTRRDNVVSPINTKIDKYDNIKNYTDKIDVMLMCGGSKDDLTWQSAETLQHFNIIDTFDTHQDIPKHKDQLKQVSNNFHKSAIYSCGWDPGLLSCIRAYFKGLINPENIYTFWGEGMSLGHSEVLRKIDGVENAVQFTVPDEESLDMALKYPINTIPENKLHRRVCYLATKQNADKDKIANIIVNTEHYFKGQNVQINFVEPTIIQKLIQKTSHRGKVVATKDDKTKAMFDVSMASNPSFTAGIMLAYAKIILKLPCGVYSPLDIAPINLISNDDKIL